MIVDRAAAIEMIVVFGDGQHSFARDVAAAQDVLQKRNHVFAFFRTAKRNNKKGIEAGHNFILVW